MRIGTRQSLLERDAELGGLGVLLDPQALRAWLGEHAVDSAQARTTYVRYKPGTSLTAGLEVAGGPAFGYAVAPHAAPKLDKLVSRAPVGSVLAHDPQRRLAVVRPVADRDLPGLRADSIGALRILAYKPQRRLVGVVRTPRGATSVLRCYRPPDMAAAVDRWPAPGGPIRVPAVRAVHPGLGTMLLDRLPGAPLPTLRGRAADDAWLRTGRMLGRWHVQAGPAARSMPSIDLNRVAAEVAWLLPDEADRAADLAARLSTRHEAEPDPVWCHGDFSGDQVLIDEEGEPALLDWDRSGSAPPASDLATADAAHADLAEQESTRRWQALLAGYTEVRAEPPRLKAARARAHLRRVAEPFRHADPQWPERVRRRLDLVEEMT